MTHTDIFYAFWGNREKNVWTSGEINPFYGWCIKSLSFFIYDSALFGSVLPRYLSFLDLRDKASSPGSKRYQSTDLLQHVVRWVTLCWCSEMIQSWVIRRENNMVVLQKKTVQNKFLLKQLLVEAWAVMMLWWCSGNIFLLWLFLFSEHFTFKLFCFTFSQQDWNHGTVCWAKALNYSCATRYFSSSQPFCLRNNQCSSVPH